jgi:predicted lipoprotein with Yx(FWY)xxD motif
MSRMTTRWPMHRSGIVRLVGIVVITLFVAACGSSGSSSGSDSSTSGSSGPVLGVASTSLGRVLVDGDGFTVYMFTSDSPNHSTCSSDCLQFWPLVAAPSGGSVPSISGISADLGVTQATNGESMVTANGIPLYTFTDDTAPGVVNGEGNEKFGGTWYVLSPAGQPIKTSPSSTDSGGYGSY